MTEMFKTEDETLIITTKDGTIIRVYAWTKGYDGAPMHYDVTVDGTHAYDT